MYQLEYGVYHPRISKGVAENLFVKTDIEVLNNHSTFATNDPSLENTACQVEKARSQITESLSRQIQENNTLSGK